MVASLEVLIVDDDFMEMFIVRWNCLLNSSTFSSLKKKVKLKNMPIVFFHT